MTALLIVLAVLIILGAAAWALSTGQVRSRARIAAEEQYAVWRLRQVVNDAQRKMREAAREHLP